MNNSTTTEPQNHYYLYTYPDGQERVFEVCGLSYVSYAYAVVDKAPVDPDARYLDINLPEDLATAGHEITEEEAKQLTGYYLEGRRAVEYALLTLDRVATSDDLYLVSQAAEAMLAGLAPDVLPACSGNIFQERIEADRAARKAHDLQPAGEQVK